VSTEAKAIDKITESTKIADTLHGAIKAISAMTASDTLTNIIRLVALLFMSIGWILLRKRLTRVLIQKAKELSELEKDELRKYLASIHERVDDSIVTDLEQGF
jgi:hypothetical protein